MNTLYQLRKIGLPASVEKVKNCYRIISGTTLIGRGQAVDVFLDSNIRKGLISRAHAQIILKDGKDAEPVYEIFDSSLNGTYVNDVRINGSVVLKEGDTIAFGHLRGSLIKPGTLAPQKETEFLFKFEKCTYPEIKEEMVDLTEKELNNNSSVFMSPKSPNGENANCVLRVPSPPEKKMKYSPTQDVKSQDSDSKIYSDDEEDLKAVVAAATAKIKYNGDTSDDGSFQVDINSKVTEVGSEQVLLSGPMKQFHPRNRIIQPPPSFLDNPLYASTLHNAAEQRMNGSTIKTNKERKKSEKMINGIIDSDDSEIESESESEYIEDSDSDSEKSEEIPDDSSDNEYVPQGKSSVNKNISKSVNRNFNQNVTKKQPPAHIRLKAPIQKMKNKVDEKSRAQNQKRKKSDSFTHDKCDSANCKLPSGSLKTVTWVQCDDCDAWYHVSCSGLSIADVKKKDSIFRCGCS